MAQILLVPVFLNHWEPSIYGLWIGIIGLAGLIQFVDFGHHNYIGFEALRLGAHSRSNIAKIYKSGVRIALGVSTIELLVVTGLVLSGFHMTILGALPDENGHLSLAVGVLLVLHSVSWLLFGNWSSVGGRVLVPFGYYPKIAWWQVAGAIVTAVAPAIAVLLGAGLLEAGVVHHIAHAMYALPAVLYVRRMIEREGLNVSNVDYRSGFRTYLHSLSLSLKMVLEMFRQEQFRMVIAPIVGATQLAVFVTTRTVANILVSGLGTISGPLMPELMGYLNRKDADKTIGAMSVVWIVLVAIMAPCAVAAQLFMAPLFEIWTSGKIAFDPTLFGLFSMTVLLFTLGQPAASILQGLNIVRPQIAISLCATVIALVSTFYFAPVFGVKGAAASLFVGEISVSVCSLFVMRRIFRSFNMSWPKKQVLIATVAVCFSCFLIMIASQTARNKELMLFSALACAVVSSLLLINTLPRELRMNALRTFVQARA